MIGSRVLFGVVLAVNLLLAGCGEISPCSNLCKEVLPDLLEQLPDLTAEDVGCEQPPWTNAFSCDKCVQILERRYDVVINAEKKTCRKHCLF